jgi:hypothetical protein
MASAGLPDGVMEFEATYGLLCSATAAAKPIAIAVVL